MMPNRVRNETIQIRNRILADLKHIYSTEWEEIRSEAEYLINEMYLDSESRSQAERLKYAGRNNNKNKLIGLIVLTAVSANKKAIKCINAGMSEIYSINAGDAVSYLLKRTGAVLVEKGIDTQAFLSKHTVRRYNNAVDSRYVSRQVMREIINMLKLGEGTKKIADRLEKIYGFNRTSAFRTVLTETTRIQARGRLDVMLEAEKRGMKFKKIWRHGVHVASPRDWHIALDGTAVELNDFFYTARGNHLMYPGDPDAPAEEVVNCHCFLDEELIR